MPSPLKNSKSLDKTLCHRWYRSVLAFPDHLVADALLGCKAKDPVVLDPFVGTGTTLVEARLRGFRAIGVDAIPFYAFVSRTKVDWSTDATALLDKFSKIAKKADARVSTTHRVKSGGWLQADERNIVGDENQGTLDSPVTASTAYVHPFNLVQAIGFRDAIRQVSDTAIRDKLSLALASSFVRIANVRFGPEIYLTPSKGPLSLESLMHEHVRDMSMDLQILNNLRSPRSTVFVGDSREMGALLDPRSIDRVICSPPYPVDKDYTRQARLEMLLLGFIETRDDLQEMKRRMLRSSTRQIFAGDDDYTAVAKIDSVQRLIHEITRRSKRDGDTSGFSEMYPKLVGNYFGGMRRHFESLLPLLRQGAQCVYVLGDSRSFKQVHIRTARILAHIAKLSGFSVKALDLWRTRRSTRLGKPLPEYIMRLSKQL